MPVTVQGPDGNTYQFPDGTDKAGAIAYFKKKGIGAEAKGPAPKKEIPFTDPHPGENPVKAFFRGGAGAAANLVQHPVDAIFGMPNLGGMPGVAYGPAGAESTRAQVQGVKENAASVREMVNQAKQNPAYTAGGLILPAVVTHGVVKAAKGLAPGGFGDSMRKGVQSMVGAGEKDVREIVAKRAVDANKDYELAKSKNQDATERTLDDRAKVDEANFLKEAKEARERIAARRENRGATARHATDTAEVRAANKEAVRAQSKIEPTQEKLKTAKRELQAQIETARNNALKEGNAKYNAVHAELNPIEANGEAIGRGLEDAHGKITGTYTEPPILKAIEKSLTRDTMTYEDLQGYYTELGKELSKGTLHGDLYQAYDTMHEALGDDMQRIAETKGMGKQLKDARNYWRRMKQTFGKLYNPTDAGNAVLEKATGQGAADDQANRVRLLGSFDKTIPQTVDHIGNLREGLKALGEKKPVRETVNLLPEEPKPAKIPAPEPQKPYSEPRPTTSTTRPDINTHEIRERLLDKWTAGEAQLSKFQVRSLVGGGLGAVIGGLFKGKMGAGVGGMVGSAFGPVAIARLAETAGVREWLSHPPKGELETLRRLPSADRLRITDTLNRVIDQAPKLGKPIRVAPAVRALLTGPGALAPRQHPTDAWQGIPAQ